MMTPIERAIAKAGGLTRLAAQCSVSYQAVQKWLRTGRVPAERVLAVERASGGEVTRHELRPDLYPEEMVRAGARKRRAVG